MNPSSSSSMLFVMSKTVIDPAGSQEYFGPGMPRVYYLPDDIIELNRYICRMERIQNL